MVVKMKKEGKMSSIVKKEFLVFGVNKYLIEEAESLGAVVSYVMVGGGGSFKISSSDGSIGGSVPVTGQVMTLIKIGKLGPASKQAIQYQIEGYLNKVIMYEKGKISVPHVKEPCKVVELSIPTDMWDSEPSVKPVGEDMIPSCGSLKNAGKVLEKVSGTSAGSVYIVVAILKGAAMAVRWKNGTLSIRVEGDSLSGYSDALKDLGFMVKKDYASVHYDVKDSGLVCKTVGAILGRVGLLNIVDMCDLMEGVCNEQ